MKLIDSKNRIGILGGTFDPIHLGHLIIGEQARMELGLSKVVFVPAGKPWLKSDEMVTSVEHREQMVRLATATNSNFQVSTVEVDRPGPSYTVDTVEMMKQELGSQAQLFLIMGADVLNELPRWREPQRLSQMCEFVVVPRASRGNPQDLESNIPGITSRIVWLNSPEIGFGSTMIRARVAQGLSIRYLVPEKVEKYITENCLYRIDR